MNVVLVDGLNLSFRMHFPHIHLSTKEGVKTGVLYGVLSSIPQLKKHLGDDIKIVWCWEGGLSLEGQVVKIEKPWRRTLFSNSYKSNRKASPDRAIIMEQVDKLLKITHVLGYPQTYVPGLEADDLIGILSQVLSDQGHKVYILTTDRDMFQCIASNVQVVRPGKGKLEYYTELRVLKEYMVSPSGWAQYKALVGDPSDNYKGVPGVGPAKAVKLLSYRAHPGLPFADQPASVKTGFSELKGHWSEAQKCYQLSVIPRSVTFPHFTKDVRTELKQQLAAVDSTLHRTSNKESTFEKNLGLWTSFCVEHELLSFLKDRRRFFS